MYYPHATSYKDIIGIGLSLGVHWPLLPDAEGNVSFNFKDIDNSKFGWGFSPPWAGIDSKRGGAAYLDMNGTWPLVEGIHVTGK